MQNIRVVLLGPTTDQKGGMATVQASILSMGDRYPDLSLSHISTHDEGSSVHRIAIFLKALRRFLGILLKNEADVFHMHVSERGSVVRKSILTVAAITFRKSVIMHTHGCEFHTFYENLPAIGQSFVSWVFQQCDYVIALSDSWKDYYVSRCGLDARKVLVLHNPVEIPDAIPNRQGGEKVRFTFLGRVGKRKGALDLIQAFSRLSPEQKRRSELTLAGDGIVEQATEMVKALDLEDHVTLPGWIDRDERNKILQASDVFVLPSYNEGLPVAMLEAMAWGLPVITTPVGGIPEVVTPDQHGILVEPGDVETLSASLQAFIESEELRLTMGKNARKRVEPFNLDSYFSTLAVVYRSVVGDRIAMNVHPQTTTKPLDSLE